MKVIIREPTAKRLRAEAKKQKRSASRMAEVIIDEKLALPPATPSVMIDGKRETLDAHPLRYNAPSPK